MSLSSDAHFCKKCQKDTPYSEILVRKPSKYDTDRSVIGRIKLFAHTLINGGNYHDMDRYVTCKVCGLKELDNKGQEHE